MAQLSIQNQTTRPLMLPGLYRTSPVQPSQTVMINVPDTDEYLFKTSVQDLIVSGSILVKLTSSDALLRPLQVWTTATMPAAASVVNGTVVWDSTDRTFMVSDGTSWSTVVDSAAVLATVGAADIAANRFVGLDTNALLVAAPTATERMTGVTTEAGIAGGTVRVAVGGEVNVMASADILVNSDLVAMPNGYAAPYQVTDVVLGAAQRGADAFDDIVQANLPGVQVVCAGDETGGTVVVYGVVGGAYTVETIALGTADTYASTGVFTDVYGLNVTKAAVGTIDIRGNGGVNLIAQIAGTTAARFYGAVVPTSTASVGHLVTLVADNANASDVVLLGTDYAGNVQHEIITMDGTTPVTSTTAFRTTTQILIGADGIAFGAAGSAYTSRVNADPRRTVRAVANETVAVAGSTVSCTLLTQNHGIQVGCFPAPYFSEIVGITGAAGGPPATVDVTVPGLLATDVIQTTLKSRANVVTLLMASQTAADTLTLSFSGDPGASTISVTIWRLQ